MQSPREPVVRRI